MTQAHIDLQSQLDSQNISNISDPSTTPLCYNSPISFLSPLEPTSNQIVQMDTTHKSSDTDNNEIPSQKHKSPEHSLSTPPPSKKYDNERSYISYFSCISTTHLSKRFHFNTKR